MICNKTIQHKSMSQHDILVWRTSTTEGSQKKFGVLAEKIYFNDKNRSRAISRDFKRKPLLIFFSPLLKKQRKHPTKNMHMKAIKNAFPMHYKRNPNVPAL